MGMGQRQGFIASTSTRQPFGVSSMPAVSRMDLVLARTMTVPSGTTDPTSLVPACAWMRARIWAGTVVFRLAVMVDSAKALPLQT